MTKNLRTYAYEARVAYLEGRRLLGRYSVVCGSEDRIGLITVTCLKDVASIHAAIRDRNPSIAEFPDFEGPHTYYQNNEETIFWDFRRMDQEKIEEVKACLLDIYRGS